MWSVGNFVTQSTSTPLFVELKRQVCIILHHVKFLWSARLIGRNRNTLTKPGLGAIIFRVRLSGFGITARFIRFESVEFGLSSIFAVKNVRNVRRSCRKNCLQKTLRKKLYSRIQLLAISSLLERKLVVGKRRLNVKSSGRCIGNNFHLKFNADVDSISDK